MSPSIRERFWRAVERIARRRQHEIAQATCRSAVDGKRHCARCSGRTGSERAIKCCLCDAPLEVRP